MKLESILQEILSDKLWHFTKIDNAFDIITHNEFILTLGLKSDYSKDSKDKYYFLSTARQQHGGYGDAYRCRLELDGRSLSHNFRGKAFKYFKTKDKRDTEYEDRIFSDTSKIPNAIKYIKQVDLYLPSDELKSGILYSYLDLIELCVEKNIKCVLFFKDNTFKSGRNGFNIENEENYKQFLDDINFDPANDTRKIKSFQKKHIKKPDNPLPLVFYIYVLTLQGVDEQKVLTLFLNNKKNKSDFDEDKENINWLDDAEYKDYNDYILTNWKALKSRKLRYIEELKEDYKKDKLETTILRTMFNKYVYIGHVQKELIDLILLNARRKQIKLSNVMDYLQTLIINDIEK